VTDKLIYPRPSPRDLAVHTLLHDLQEDEGLFQEFLAHREEVSRRFGVDAEATRLLVDLDYPGLVARGIHPILVVQLQRHIEWGMRMSTTAPEGD